MGKLAMRVLLLLLCLCLSNIASAMEARLTLKEIVFEVEIAISYQERKKGLSGRKSLAENKGMLFVYDPPNIVSFWMKDTYIPLDILFFDRNGKLLEIVHNAPPCKKMPCPKYTNKKPATFVLEIAAGLSEKYGFEPGDVFYTDIQNHNLE